MEQRLTATEARVHFGELLRRVAEDGETVIVERGGSAAAVVLPIETYERWKAGEPPLGWREALDVAREVRKSISHRVGERGFPSPDEVLREAREERDAELVGRR